MDSPTRRCPVEHAGAALVTHSFDQVAESFVEFRSNRDNEEYTPRGGNARPNKKPRSVVPAGASYTRLPGYGVESTFNQQQKAYVAISIAGLYQLIRGDLIVPHETRPGRFSDRVVEDILNQDPSRISFGGALARKVLGLFNDFGTYYPNLLPALSAMSRTGGGEGADIAVGASQEMLSAAIRGADPLDGIAHLAIGASADRFTMAHPYYGDNKTHEVWCPGESVAKGIIRASGAAAITLAAMPDLVEAYGTPFLDPFDNDRVGLREKIETRISEMYNAAL